MPQGWSKWIAVLASGVVVSLPLGASTATGAISIPSVTVPGTQLPGAELPGVTTPSVQLPGVSVPSTQLPGVQVPSTQLPSTSTPSVSLPATSSSTPTKTPSQPLAGGSTQLPGGSSPTGTAPGSGPLSGGGGGPSGSGGGSSGPSSSGAGGSSGAGSHSGSRATGSRGPGGRSRGASADTTARLASTAEQLRSTLAPLRGCFYGLTSPERSVLILRAGLVGQPPHSRLQVANRLNTSTRQVAHTEQRAVQRLRSLAQTDGCGSAAGLGVTVVNNVIGPAEVAASPGLVAFGNPAYQGAAQSAFSRRGPVVDFNSPAPLPANFGASVTSGSTWAAQLLAVMLLVALAGFLQFFPLSASRRRRHGRLRVLPPGLEHLQGLPDDEVDRGASIPPPAEREKEKVAA
jgi:hypothetical protein